MARVLVRCPLTRLVVFTGLILSHTSFETEPPLPQFFLCRSCWQSHTWKAGTAFLEADSEETA